MTPLRTLSRLAVLMLACATAAPAQQPVPGAPQAGAQTAPLPPIVSPVIHEDRTVTFSIRAPRATQVIVGGGEFRPPQQRRAMQKDSAGVWSVTLGPLEPDVYVYVFVIDGVPVPDPANPSVKQALRNPASLLQVLGDSAQPWDVTAVPHGAVHLRWYFSNNVGGGTLRSIYVYTPPGFEGSAERYPVLFLLHGPADTESEWTFTGRVNLMLDNLIAAKKARPMIVVMPYVQPQQTVKLGLPGALDPDPSALVNDLVADVMPMVEKNYRASTRPDERAIAGNSTGGRQALSIGLAHTEYFHWVASFSTALPRADSMFARAFGQQIADPAATNRALKLLWLASGKDDPQVQLSRQFAQFLTARGITNTFVETDGANDWTVWRRDLVQLLPLLFRP